MEAILKSKNMTVYKSDQEIFSRLFNLRVKQLVDDMTDYRNILLSQILESKSKTIKADRDFMIDMAEEGFVRAIKLFCDAAIEKQEAEQNIQDQINDILDL